MSSTGNYLETTPLLPLASKPSCHGSDLAALRYGYAHHLIYACREVGVIFAGKYFYIHDLSTFAMRHTQGCIFHIARDFSPKMARNRRFFGGEFLFAFGSDLPDQNIRSVRLRHQLRMIPVSSRSLIASSPTLGISRVISSGPSLVSRASTSYFSIMDGRKTIILHQSLGKKDSHPRNCPLPGEKSHNHILTQGKLTALGEEESAIMSPFLMTWPFTTDGLWSIQVD